MLKKKILFLIIILACITVLLLVCSRFCSLKSGCCLFKNASVKKPVSIYAEKYFEEGKNLYRERKFDAAIDNFSKAIAADPNFAKAYCEMAVAYMEIGDFDAGSNSLQKAIKLDPNYPKAEYAAAVCCARRTPPDLIKAREHFEKSKKLGYRAPEWFERFLSSLEAKEQ